MLSDSVLWRVEIEEAASRGQKEVGTREKCGREEVKSYRSARDRCLAVVSGVPRSSNPIGRKYRMDEDKLTSSRSIFKHAWSQQLSVTHRGWFIIALKRAIMNVRVNMKKSLVPCDSRVFVTICGTESSDWQ